MERGREAANYDYGYGKWLMKQDLGQKVKINPIEVPRRIGD